MDGKLIPAIPIKLALKNTPPTLAVVYQMKDAKTGRMKKYIHEIRINFDKQEQGQEVDINRMCDEICRKETTYLNPAFISRQQVVALVKKLHQTYLKTKEAKNKVAQNDANKKNEDKDEADKNFENSKGRKPNFFDRKRFLNYENNEDNDDSKSDIKVDDKKQNDAQPSKDAPEKQLASDKEEPAKPPVLNDMFEVEEEEIVSMPAAKKSKPMAVRSAAPPKKAQNPIEVDQIVLDVK